MLGGSHAFHLTKVINRIFVFYYKDGRMADRQIWVSELFLLIDFRIREGLNLLMENQICSRRIMNCPSFKLQSNHGSWHNFYLYTHCSKQRKFAHSKEKPLTKIKVAQSKNLLKNLPTTEICSQNRKTAQNEKPCRLRWINTMAKCLAPCQSEHGWRAPLNVFSCNGWNVLGRTFLQSQLCSNWNEDCALDGQYVNTSQS